MSPFGCCVPRGHNACRERRRTERRYADTKSDEDRKKFMAFCRKTEWPCSLRDCRCCTKSLATIETSQKSSAPRMLNRCMVKGTEHWYPCRWPLLLFLRQTKVDSTKDRRWATGITHLSAEMLIGTVDQQAHHVSTSHGRWSCQANWIGAVGRHIRLTSCRHR